MPSKTVYSIYWPKTQVLFEVFCKNINHENFKYTWTKHQDKIGPDFLDKWSQWATPCLKFDRKHLSYAYCTAGSSEAIREVIVNLNTHNKKIIVFKGEYEGYSAIANAINMPVISVCRDNWLQELTDVKNFDDKVFFISNPSSIDGCFWSDFENFLKFCESHQISVYLDATYLGLAFSPVCLDLTKKACVKGIFFSLSKVFGCYYHRIGGVFLNKENPLLYGNMWFKSIPSITFGMELLNNHTLEEVYNRYGILQKEVAQSFIKEFKLETLNLSDVPLLLTLDISEMSKMGLQPIDFQRDLESNKIRLCISPEIEKILRK